MKKHVSWWAASLLTAAMVAGCGSSSGEEPWVCIHPVDSSLYHLNLTNSELKLVDETNNFAFNLFRQVAADKSAIVSPISITYALGMLNNGAAGATQTQIDTVLGFGSTGAQDINRFCHKMIAVAPALDSTTKVMIANAIFTNKDYQLNSDFVSKALTYYEAEAHSCDFRDGKTAGIINKWASDHTEGMIDNVVNEVKPYAVSYLLNAIYFKGAWSAKFDKKNTRDETFTGYKSIKKVPMMTQECTYNYRETADCQVLRMPYGNGSYSMTILLPKEGKTVADILSTLNVETWHQLAPLATAKVNVKLPRFESKTDVELNNIMATLGMPDAFDERKAEFPYFCDLPTYIGMMKQVARIKLNEEGTEAAAVTVIGSYGTTSVDPKEPERVNFHATRPFLYVISEESTGAVFFVGQYMGD